MEIFKHTQKERANHNAPQYTPYPLFNMYQQFVKLILPVH